MIYNINSKGRGEDKDFLSAPKMSNGEVLMGEEDMLRLPQIKWDKGW